jgi:hypothetical protein
MARIRTIKPEFWTDSKTGTLSDRGTKLFIGMLNFADDYGVLQFDIDALKAQIFPYLAEEAEKAVTRPLADELLAKGLVEVFGYSEDDDPETPLKQYLFIKNFGKHQRVDRPGKPLIPGWIKTSTPANFLSSTKARRSLDEGSTNTRRTIDEHSTPEGKGSGREGKGKEVDLDRKGGEGTEHALPSPPSGGGGAAAPKGNGNGQSVGEGNADSPTLNFVEGLPKPKRDALRHAVEKFNSKAWSKERVDQHLCASEFEDRELKLSEHLFASLEVPR